MSDYDKKRYAEIKADPVRYAAYLERKRNEEQARVAEGKRRSRPGKTQSWRAKNQEKAKNLRQAGHAVENAVRWKKIKKPTACVECGAEGKVEAHHHKGYAREQWLDVVWLCRKCHRKLG